VDWTTNESKPSSPQSSLVRLRSYVHQLALAAMADDVRSSSYVSLATRMAQLAHVLLRPVAGGGSSLQAASRMCHPCMASTLVSRAQSR
jgi:hypothetical protein